jgi:hypothetical protein
MDYELLTEFTKRLKVRTRDSEVYPLSTIDQCAQFEEMLCVLGYTLDEYALMVDRSTKVLREKADALLLRYQTKDRTRRWKINHLAREYNNPRLCDHEHIATVCASTKGMYLAEELGVSDWEARKLVANYGWNNQEGVAWIRDCAARYRKPQLLVYDELLCVFQGYQGDISKCAFHLGVNYDDAYALVSLYRLHERANERGPHHYLKYQTQRRA